MTHEPPDFYHSFANICTLLLQNLIQQTEHLQSHISIPVNIVSKTFRILPPRVLSVILHVDRRPDNKYDLINHVVDGITTRVPWLCYCSNTSSAGRATKLCKIWLTVLSNSMSCTAATQSWGGFRELRLVLAKLKAVHQYFTEKCNTKQGPLFKVLWKIEWNWCHSALSFACAALKALSTKTRLCSYCISGKFSNKKNK